MHTHTQVDDFLQALVNFDKEHIPEATVRCVKEEHLSDPEFNPEFVRQKSSAAAGLCAWVINIVRFHEVQQLCDAFCVFTVLHVFTAVSSRVLFISSTPDFPWIDFCKYSATPPFVINIV